MVQNKTKQNETKQKDHGEHWHPTILCEHIIYALAYIQLLTQI